MKKSDLDLFFKIQKSLEKIEQQNQGDILRTYARALRDINKKVKDIYIRYAKDGVLSNTDKTVLNQMASIEKQAAAILGKRHSEVENMINQRARLSYGESFFKHAYFIDKTANLNLDWGTIPTNAVEFAFNNNYELLVKGQTFKKALNSSLTKVQDVFSTALIEGKSYQEVARNLVKVLGVEAVGFDAARYVGHGVSSWALMTSRTELHRAVVQGQQKTFETAKENGIDVKEVWCATLDGRTRLEHGHLDGQYKDEKEDGWWVPELSMFVKGPNQSGVAAFDINCRCCVLPEVMGLKSEERYIRGEGITQYENYDDWKNKKQINHFSQELSKDNFKSMENNTFEAPSSFFQKEFDNISDFTTQDLVNLSNDVIENAPPEFKRVFLLMSNDTNFGLNFNIADAPNGSPAGYSPNKRLIRFSNAKLKNGYFSARDTMVHELSHATSHYFSISGNGKLSENESFRKACQGFIQKLMKNKEELTEDGLRWKLFLNQFPNDSSWRIAYLSDFLGSLTKNGVVGKGHPTSYYNTLDRCYEEALADLMTMVYRNGIELDYLNLIDKTSTENVIMVLEKILKGM